MAEADDDAARARLKTALDAVRARFVAGLEARTGALAELALAARERRSPGPDLARADLLRGLHSIAGSAPTVGLRDLGARARVLEAMVAAAERDGRGVPDIVEDIRSLAAYRT
ncbi:Hpt domain-containing protein [Methylopila henanensis]|uniref:Hpt domain-containing protein n=1 Tax=Methylopila henanensis TaxID=873516 RepID=A0ABW4K423_9HYPH